MMLGARTSAEMGILLASVLQPLASSQKAESTRQICRGCRALQALIIEHSILFAALSPAKLRRCVRGAAERWTLHQCSERRGRVAPARRCGPSRRSTKARCPAKNKKRFAHRFSARPKQGVPRPVTRRPSKKRRSRRWKRRGRRPKRGRRLSGQVVLSRTTSRQHHYLRGRRGPRRSTPRSSARIDATYIRKNCYGTRETRSSRRLKWWKTSRLL